MATWRKILPHGTVEMFSNRSTEDVITAVIHSILGQPGTHARLLFLDFSSTLNTIEPHLMMRNLMVMDVNLLIISWLCGLLTDRP
ncbi:hypothetical protein ACOMHN_064434 [Nucella lapillus]